MSFNPAMKGVLLVAALHLIGCFRMFDYGSSNEELITEDDADVGADADSDADVDEGVIEEDVCVPAVEVCNGIDDNCNGEVDEDFECSHGQVMSCSFCGLVGEQVCGNDCTFSPCDASCGAGLECCADLCVDVQTDVFHCGVCDTFCGVDWICEGGVCVDAS